MAVQPSTWRAGSASETSDTLHGINDRPAAPESPCNPCGVRTTARTDSPRSSNCLTNSRPVAPLAPITNVVILDPCLFIIRKHMATPIIQVGDMICAA
jgi:hypothetical protein